MEESIAQPMTKERLMRYRSLRMENENQLERLARMKSGEQFPVMREGDGSAARRRRGQIDRCGASPHGI